MGGDDAHRSAEVSRRREIAEAGHLGDAVAARAALFDPEASVRATAIGALERLGALTAADIVTTLYEPGDAVAAVRRRAAEAAARFPGVGLRQALDDRDWSVIEMVCWSLGEHEAADSDTLTLLIHLASDHPEPLVREASVAALGAIGDELGLPAIIRATSDKAAVRRRAAVALAPFDSPAAADALRALLTDRDWQTRQIAEDLLDER